jgi:hypothetical protein
MGAQIFDFDDPLPSLLYWDASFLDDFLLVDGLRIFTCNPRILSRR